MTQLSSWIIQKGPQTSKLLFESLNLFTVLLTYRSNKTIRLHMKRNGDDKNQHPSGLMVISVPRLIKKRFPASPLGPEWGRPDWTLGWQTQPANEYHRGEGEMITIQPAQRHERYNRRKKSKRNVKSKKRTVHPSLLVAKPFVNETNALARNSLGS